ncbi:Glucan endo-1,3-beta-glucosidase [Glycine soja]|uniref:glucan endo-1,3-beta-D-glucosidase n=1 Tax=Glycine soja TaxID=3848 RepID=A0A445EZW8_GLYSO|nr:Glucan endo-1,3-beta-glucosidase [Glycine soja]
MAEIEPCPFLLLALFSCTLFNASSTAKIGVNYGTVADNLPPPSTVAAFLISQTTIDRVKLFDANPAILRAFAGTGISVTVTVPNADIPSLSTLPAAQAWLSANLLPFLPATSDKTLISHILPTMKSLHEALTISNLTTIQVSTPHSLGILSTSNPPSAAAFRRGYDRAIFAPILNFHRETKSPFMINPNMFDAQMDAVFSAMKRLGFADVELIVAKRVGPLWVTRINRPTVSERNSGLFKPDLTPVYHVAVYTAKQALGPTSRPMALTPSESPASSSSSSKKTNASEAVLQANIDFVCRRSGIDSGPIKDGGPCFKPNTVRPHAAYAMNAYYQASGRHDFDCNFGHTGLVIYTDPGK